MYCIAGKHEASDGDVQEPVSLLISITISHFPHAVRHSSGVQRPKAQRKREAIGKPKHSDMHCHHGNP